MSVRIFGVVLSGLVLFLGSCVLLPRQYNPYELRLIQASRYGDEREVKRLLKAGEDINRVDRSETALDVAAARGDLPMVKFLISRGANSWVSAYGRAWQNKEWDVARYFLDNGYVDVNDTALSYGNFLDDETISFEQRLEKLNEMTGKKLNSPYLLVHVKKERYQQVIDFFGINLKTKVGDLGQSILHVASDRIDRNLVEFLLKQQFDVNSLDDNGRTALYYAAFSFRRKVIWANAISENETSAMINFSGAMINYRNSRKSEEDQVAIVRDLLSAGIDVNHQDKGGWTVLHFAAAAKNMGLQEFLISNGASQELRNSYGRTAGDIVRLSNR